MSFRAKERRDGSSYRYPISPSNQEYSGVPLEINKISSLSNMRYWGAIISSCADKSLKWAHNTIVVKAYSEEEALKKIKGIDPYASILFFTELTDEAYRDVKEGRMKLE